MHQIWYGNASDGNPVDVVESFTFLGSIQTSDGYCKPDIACQIVSRSRQCRHSITSGMLNIFLFRRKVVFIKHWFCQSCYMRPKRGPQLPVTWKPSNPFSWSVSEGSSKTGGMILSVTLRSLYALVSHLCLTGLSEVAMPYSDMWQDCQTTLQHTRPCYTKSSYWLLVGRPPDPSWKRPPGRPQYLDMDIVWRRLYKDEVLVWIFWDQGQLYLFVSHYTDDAR